MIAATWLRYEFDFSQVDIGGLLFMTSVTVGALCVVGTASQAYLGRYATGSLEEALNLVRVNMVVGAFAFGITILRATPPIPRSVPFTATLLALALCLAVRLTVRHCRARNARPNRSSARRAIVYGAGTDGRDVIRSMLSRRSGDIIPVALLDDDPALRHGKFAGIAVRGTGSRLAAVAYETGAEVLVVAFSSPSPAQLRAIFGAAEQAGLEVKILPPMAELLRPWVQASDLRDLDMAALLGRKEVETDLGSIAGYLTGQRVLVTGAGGSIGSELCRQIHTFEPAEVLMLDRDESALHAVQLSIHAEARLDSPSVILGDIRDGEAMHAVVKKCRPDVVFHAAALKHLSVLERYPDEAWKTNVLGTLKVLHAARSAGVRRFVNVSTDKAANPTSVLGRSKRIGERLVANAARETGGTFLSVRFGNVLGSRGSVLTTFAEQLATGHPVTVTHPDVTRFFMTVPEAVQLVIQAAAIGSSGEALVLDMGQPARVADLARALMTMSGLRSQIIFTGLGKGEKLHEELFGTGEEDYRPVHPAISHIVVPPLDPETVLARCAQVGCAEALAELADVRAYPTGGCTATRTNPSTAETISVRVGATSRYGTESGNQ